MVMTTSAARMISSVHGFGNSVRISIPTSAIASIAAGLTVLAGSEPPEKTSTRSPARWFSQPAAICERPALCTHRNRTLGLPLIESSSDDIGSSRRTLGIEHQDEPVGDGGSD